MAITVAAGKAKGRRFQQKIRDIFRDLGSNVGLVDDDIESTPLGVSGTDVRMSPQARKYFPWYVECKNTETFRMMEAWRQVEAGVSQPDAANVEPIVFASRNRAPIEFAIMYVTIYHQLYAGMEGYSYPVQINKLSLNLWRELAVNNEKLGLDRWDPNLALSITNKDFPHNADLRLCVISLEKFTALERQRLEAIHV